MTMLKFWLSVIHLPVVLPHKNHRNRHASGFTQAYYTCNSVQQAGVELSSLLTAVPNFHTGKHNFFF
jgi:hypothetical protein